MILTETVHHTHNHGATGFEIYLWVLAAISTMWLLEDGWERAKKWWRKWRGKHGSTSTEDAAEDPEAGEPWTPPEAPTRDEAAARVAQRSET